jgi:hypothetical protein
MRRLRVMVVWALVAGTIVTAGAAVDVPAATVGFVPNEVIVGLEPGIAVGGVAAALNGRVDRALLSGDAFVLTVGNPTAAAALAMGLPGVRYAEPNWIRQLHSHGGSPDDPDFHLKWDLHNDGSLADGADTPTAGADIDFLSAYTVLSGASLSPTTVAILDTGIDASHPDLDDKIVAGWDFIGNDPTPQDGFGHGTHVGGIAAAETNNGTGTAGVGFPTAIQIMPIKVCDDNGSCPSDAIANGIRFAADNGASVVNLSLGGSEISQTEVDAINYADVKDVLIVASAGNSDVSTKNYPAAQEPVMAIAATDWDDAKASYSNFGSDWVDLAAPGGDMDKYDDPEGIYSTMPTYKVFLTSCRAMGLLSPCYDLNYDQLAGTSMAAPQVAGAAALLYAMGAGTNDDIRALLESTSDPLADGRLGAGRLNIGSAVAAIGPVDPVPTVDITAPQDGATVAGTVVVTATASDDVTQVEFFVDGISTGVDSDGSDGWSVSWDTTSTADGSRTLSATATASDAQVASDSISVTVDNDAEPTVTITAPTDDSTVAGSVSVTADASDDDGVAQVEFFVDGVSIGTDNDGTNGWSVSWDTTGVDDGAHTVAAVATDTAGQTGSHSVTVTVDNEPDPAISLSVLAYKVRGLQKADLSWSGATSLDVDIYRDGAPIVTTANDGFHTDNIDGRGSGSYTYVVCEAGTTVCSNEATAGY